MPRSKPQSVAGKASVAASPSSPGLETPEELRKKILRPYFPLLHDWLKHDLESIEVPQFAELEGHCVSLGSWEQKQLKKFRTAPAFGLKPDASMVLEGVAFQFAAHRLKTCFETGPMPPPDEIPRFLDEIVAHLAVGIALESLLQNSVDGHVQRGELDDAKRIGDFRLRIVRQLADLKARVGSLELQRAEEASPVLIAAPKKEPGPAEMASDAELLRLLAEMEEPLHSWAKLGDEEPRPEKKLPPWLHDELIKPEPKTKTKLRGATHNRVKPMLVVLAALICVYSIVIWPRVSHERPPLLSEKHFVGIDGLREVRARPPSLFVVVDGLEWDSSTSEERIEMVESMGAVADAAGYSGIHLRADGGRVVAEWLRTTGAALRQASNGGS